MALEMMATIYVPRAQPVVRSVGVRHQVDCGGLSLAFESAEHLDEWLMHLRFRFLTSDELDEGLGDEAKARIRQRLEALVEELDESKRPRQVPGMCGALFADGAHRCDLPPGHAGRCEYDR